MKLYGYQDENGKIKRGEIDVEEKVILVPKDGRDFPLIFGKQINVEDVGKVIGFWPTVFLKESDFEHAKELLLQKARETLSEKESTRERFSKDVEDFKKQMESLKNEVENFEETEV